MRRVRSYDEEAVRSPATHRAPRPRPPLPHRLAVARALGKAGKNTIFPSGTYWLAFGPVAERPKI